jgi:hypothetical protein
MFNLHQSAIKHGPRLPVPRCHYFRTRHAASSELASRQVDIPEPGFRDVRTIHPEHVLAVVIGHEQVEVRLPTEVDNVVPAVDFVTIT